MNIKFIAGISLVLFSLGAATKQIIYPPLTVQTIVGSWEAIQSLGSDKLWPDVLWHLEIGKKDGDTYLAQMTPDGTHCVIWEVVSSTISDEKVKFHFGKPLDSLEPGGRDLWIAGTASGTNTEGVINANLFDADPDRGLYSNDRPKVYFVKGTWTRDLAEASRTAEKAIRERKGRKK